MPAAQRGSSPYTWLCHTVVNPMAANSPVVRGKNEVWVARKSPLKLWQAGAVTSFAPWWLYRATHLTLANGIETHRDIALGRNAVLISQKTRRWTWHHPPERLAQSTLVSVHPVRVHMQVLAN